MTNAGTTIQTEMMPPVNRSAINHSVNPSDRDFIARVFLQKLAVAAANGHVALNDWEEQFVNNCCGLTRFTSGQRFKIDALFKKYSAELPLAVTPKPRRPAPPKMSPARAGELFAAAKKEAGL